MKILVIGTGYVGTTTALVFAELGHKITGLEIDSNKVDKLLQGKLHFYEAGLEDLLKKHLITGNIEFTMDSERAINDNDIIFICVGTPSNGDGSANLSYVEQVARSIGKHLNGYKIIVNKSTVPVGTVDKVHEWIGESDSSGCRYDVISNPEFLREGSALKDAMHPDRIVIGSDSEAAAKKIGEIYSGLNSPVVYTKPKAAELIKYASNSFLALKISFINELARLCDLLQIDIKDVSKGMGMDHRIGKHFLHAGIGYGGSCFPKDISALLDIAMNNGVELSILKTAKEVNRTQSSYMIEIIKRKIGTMKGKHFAVLGLTFKPFTDDLRESPSLSIIEQLLKEEAIVTVHDPIAFLPADLTQKGVKQFGNPHQAAHGVDAIVICTDWPIYKYLDWNKIKEVMRAPYVFDGRNMLNADRMKASGFLYRGIGYSSVAKENS